MSARKVKKSKTADAAYQHGYDAGHTSGYEQGLSEASSMFASAVATVKRTEADLFVERTARLNQAFAEERQRREVWHDSTIDTWKRRVSDTERTLRFTGWFAVAMTICFLSLLVARVVLP